LYTKQHALRLLVALLALESLGETNSVDWWSNRTNSLHVYQHAAVPGSVRLDSYTSGFVEGSIHLVTNGEWRLRVVVLTDETYTSLNEQVDLYLNGAFAHRWTNSPLDTYYTNEFVVMGAELSYRYDFSSPSASYASHALVLPGTVWREIRKSEISAATCQAGAITLQLTNLGYGARHAVQMCTDIKAPNWSNASEFVSWVPSTNWSAAYGSAPTGIFYRVQTTY